MLPALVLSVLLAACQETPYVNGNACIGDQRAGRWVSGGTLDLVGVHAAMLPSGLALLYGYPHGENFHDLEGGMQLWDPATRSPVTTLQAPIPNHNPFCAGESFLGDGRLFVAGGFKNGVMTDASTADRVATIRAGERTVDWRVDDKTMSAYRWYPTVVTLADGSALIIGGSRPSLTNDWNEVSEAYELYDLPQDRLIRQDETKKTFPRDAPFSFPDGDMRQMIEGGTRLAGLYPLAHLLPRVAGDDAPDGLLFFLTDSFVRVYNPDTNTIVGDKQDATGFRTWWTQGSSVLLPIEIAEDGTPPPEVRIMVVGGGTLGRGDDSTGSHMIGSTAPALTTADVWRYDVAGRSLSRAGSVTLQRPRFMGDSILLPDGNVLLVGGAETGYANNNHDRVRNAELIQPPTVFSGGTSVDFIPPAGPARGYHASALLLPDASVLVTGGTGYWVGGVDSHPPEEHKTVDIFEPPYLSAGERPRIIRSTEELRIGGTVQVTTDEVDVKPEIVLIRLGSRTHSLDTDQRMLRLAARVTRNANGSTTLTGRLPDDPSWAPPGPYFMFVLRHCTDTSPFGAVPSVGKIVSLRLAAPPEVVTDLIRVTFTTGDDDLEAGNEAIGFFTMTGGDRAQAVLNPHERWVQRSVKHVDIPLGANYLLRQVDRFGIRISDEIDDWTVDRIEFAYRDVTDLTFHDFYSTHRAPVVFVRDPVDWTIALP